VTPTEPRPAPSVELGTLLGELVEGRRWLRTVLDHLPAMVGYWGRDLRNRVANRAYVDWFGKTPEEIEGLHIRDLLGPELFAQNLPYMEAALAGTAQQFDRTIVDAQGVTRYSQASYVPDVDEHGQVDGFFVLVADVSERVRAELALAEEQQRTRALADQLRIVSRVSTALHDLEPATVQEAIADAVLDLGYDGSALVVIDWVTMTYLPTHARGVLAGVDGLTFPSGVGATQATIAAQGLVVIDDYQTDPRALPVIRATGVRTTASVPVRAEGVLQAVLHVGRCGKLPLGDTDREVLSLLADIAGTALANAHRFEASLARTLHYEQVAQTDALTGVGNRLAAERLLATTTAGDVLVVLDLDRFKAVNDRFGHAVGDDTLRALATSLRGGLRDEDRIARLGGEEFVVSLPSTDLERADGVLRRLREAWLATEPRTTFSAGVAQAREGETPRSVYERADHALYAAKRTGRDRYVLDQG
jgi:diguanylate cyclase (GGDEF)-like protein/PAS domain S-box-containing protein